MRTLKNLVLAISVAFATSASAGDLVQHENGVNYDDICSCLTNIGMEEGVHFRKGGDGRIQTNGAAVSSDFLSQGVTKQEIDSCWKKRERTKKDIACPSSKTSQARQ